MLNTLLNHRSIRKFRQLPVESQKLNSVLEAAVRGSNTGNMQVYSIVLTTDAEVKSKLWETHFKQEMVSQAPVIATFCADINRFSKWCDIQDADAGYDNFLWFMNASIDAIIAAQNFCVAAEDYDLGICYLGTTTYNADKIIEILKLPKGVVPVTSVVLGYPDEAPEKEDRLPLKGVVHFDTYSDYQKDDIEKIYQEKENSEKTKDLLKINDKENLAKIFTDNRYKKADNLLFSQKFMEVIEKQGFMNNKQ
jgi:nitroreductase